MARASALALALNSLVGGLSALAYFVAATRDILSSLAMARRDSPCSLAFCTTSQRACWVGVGVRCQLRVQSDPLVMLTFSKKVLANRPA